VQERSGTRVLAAGFHAIEVTFFERGWDQVLDVSFAGPGLPKQPIPPSLLFPEVPVPVENEPPVLESATFYVSEEREPGLWPPGAGRRR
jgi:hypothetical protein